MSSICSTYWVRIYIAGCSSIIKQLCNNFCKENTICVNVQDTEYIYDGGQEKGAIIEFINYPKSSKDPLTLSGKATYLAQYLLEKLNQNSCTVMTPESSFYHTRKVDHA